MREGGRISDLQMVSDEEEGKRGEGDEGLRREGEGREVLTMVTLSVCVGVRWIRRRTERMGNFVPHSVIASRCSKVSPYSSLTLQPSSTGQQTEHVVWLTESVSTADDADD